MGVWCLMPLSTIFCIGSNVFQVMAAVFEIAEFQFVNLNILQKFK
jgi:hypothetical protein